MKLLKQIHHTVQTITGLPFYIVGGAVVDVLYGKKPKDYDCVLPCEGMLEDEAFGLLSDLSNEFSYLGMSTKVYQSYGLNLGEKVNPTSFQAMFVGCMKVKMKHCSLDILLSRAPTITDHVKLHDCNMNMVWFDGNNIRWEHGGNDAKVERLEFREGVSDARINRMDIKRHELISLNSSLT